MTLFYYLVTFLPETCPDIHTNCHKVQHFLTPVIEREGHTCR
jgi:hypothetical protein